MNTNEWMNKLLNDLADYLSLANGHCITRKMTDEERQRIEKHLQQASSHERITEARRKYYAKYDPTNVMANI